MSAKKVIFIHHQDYKLVDHKAANYLSKTHLSCLENIYGKNNVITYKFILNYLLAVRYFLLLSMGISCDPFKSFSQIIKKENIQEVFIYCSVYGIFSWYCKKKHPHLKVIVFFHNVETDIISQNRKNITDIDSVCLIRQFEFSNLLRKYYYFFNIPVLFQPAMILMERACACYSDLIILLSERDKNLLLKYYPKTDKRKLKILPVSLTLQEINYPTIHQKEKINQISIVNKTHANNNIDLLFVASNWPPNVDGLQYFIEKVLPHLPTVTLHVAGNIYDNNQIPSHDRVILYGFVENLEKLYRQAHFMVMPIFQGGGMKIKVAQALQYGKTIFGTSEAFVGYKFNQRIGGICDDSTDFIEKITLWIKEGKTQKWNPASRELFNAEHHPAIMEKKLRVILSDG